LKTIKLPISKYIDNKFREYSLYVLMQRGIPSFYDALTPVQRYILMNSPTSFNKTLSIVGKSIQEGYHHGDKSLTGAISKLTRPFGSSLQVLEGYGFFGSEVCPEPAAPRYTSVKISKTANEILKKYNHLNTKEKDGPYVPFWMEVPIGLTTPIVGIAVGYKTTVLPRKLEDIKKFLEGKIKTIKPHFSNFSGKIKKYKKDGPKTNWIISSDIKVSGNRINVNGIPPILKYNSVLRRMDWLFGRFEGRIRVLNNSNTNVNIDIVYTGKRTDEWEEIQNYIHRIFSVIVSESPVFIKDDQVLVYDTVEEYLEDYKWQVKRLKYFHCLHERDFLSVEFEFNKIKAEFINFVLKKKRSVQEIDDFLKIFSDRIKDRLERMTSKKFTKDELKETAKKIKELERDLKNKEKELIIKKKDFESTEDPTLKRGVSSKIINTDLFDVDDIKEIDGIYVWEGEDIYEDVLEEE